MERGEDCSAQNQPHAAKLRTLSNCSILTTPRPNQRQARGSVETCSFPRLHPPDPQHGKMKSPWLNSYGTVSVIMNTPLTSLTKMVTGTRRLPTLTPNRFATATASADTGVCSGGSFAFFLPDTPSTLARCDGDGWRMNIIQRIRA